jgi:hypothetical protein
LPEKPPYQIAGCGESPTVFGRLLGPTGYLVRDTFKPGAYKPRDRGCQKQRFEQGLQRSPFGWMVSLEPE